MVCVLLHSWSVMGPGHSLHLLFKVYTMHNTNLWPVLCYTDRGQPLVTVLAVPLYRIGLYDGLQLSTSHWTSCTANHSTSSLTAPHFAWQCYSWDVEAIRSNWYHEGSCWISLDYQPGTLIEYLIKFSSLTNTHCSWPRCCLDLVMDQKSSWSLIFARDISKFLFIFTTVT